ncbi:MAG: (2Fe-2S)-binding protein [Nitrospinae bacterium]|nr:(2Fe-2S)-binding protein [Nitrospinota bacterium]
MTDLVNITIDGRAHQTKKGNVVVNAAREMGIDIPVFCYHEKLGPFGCCRLCLIEVVKIPKLVPSCTVIVNEGMEVITRSEKIDKARKGVLEFTLLNHPLDCPVCDKGGECPLQDNSYLYGPATSRFHVTDKKKRDKAYPLGELTVIDRERCILCQRCSRFTSIIEGTSALVLQNRGVSTEIETYNKEPYNSIFAGNTHDMCPTGALTSKKFRFKARPWETKAVSTVCTGCGLGCNANMNVRNDRALRLTLSDDDVVSDGWLCDIGRFGTLDYFEDDSMLSSPKDSLKKIDKYTIDAVDKIKNTWKSGNKTLSALISENVTNEEAYLLKKLVKAFDGKIACSNYYRPIITQETASVEDIDNSDTIILINADLQKVSPVLYLRLKKLADQGKTIIVIDSIKHETARLATHFYHIKQKELQNFLVSSNKSNQGRELHSLLIKSQKISLIYTPERVNTCCEELLQFIDGFKFKIKAHPLSVSFNTLGTKSIVGKEHSIVDIIHDLDKGDSNVLILYKSDIVKNFITVQNLEKILDKIKCLIVIDNQKNDTNSLAHVSIYCEKYTNYSGSIVNSEGRLQWLNNRQEKYSDGNFEIFELLFTKLGLTWNYETVCDITREIIEEEAAFKKATLDDIKNHKAFIQIPKEVSQVKNIVSKSGDISIAPYITLASGKRESVVNNLDFMVDKSPLIINSKDAAALKFKNGSTAEVKMGDNSIECNVRISDDVLAGEIGLPYFSDKAYLNRLLDPKEGFNTIELKKVGK